MTTTDAKRTSTEQIGKEIARRLAQAFDPDSIYLFGSRARGDNREDSDWDIMVVVPGAAMDSAQAYKLQQEALDDLRLSQYKDIKIWTKSDFESQLHLRASMPSAILREGKLLYSRQSTPEFTYIAPPEPATRVCEPIDPANDPVKIASTVAWLKKARNDLKIADLIIGRPDDLDAEGIYHCQQAVEKSLKAFLTWQDIVPKRIHVIEELGKACFEYDATMEATVTTVYELTKWTTEGRYPNPPPTKDLAKDSLALARNLYQAILARMPAVVQQAMPSDAI